MKFTDRRLPPWRHGLVLALVGLFVSVAAVVGAEPTTFASAPSSGHRAVHFDAPDSAAVVGRHLFVANSAGNSVTEVNASTGAFVASISGARFGFDAPAAIVAMGTDLFVANSAGNSVTEFRASSHKHILTISGLSDGLSDPIALAASAGDLFVLNGTGSVTEVNAAGALLGTASGPAFGFDQPTGLAVGDGDVFVANSAADTVTVVSTATMDFVTSLSGPAFAFSTPIGVAFDGTNVWVTNQSDESVTEFSATTLEEENVLVSGNLPMVGPITYGDGYVFAVSPPGSSPMVSQIIPSPAAVNWMMCNTNGPYLFNDPQALVVNGTVLWVVNEGGNSLTEMDADSGDLIRTIANP
jgi:hypothetical protein